MVFEELVAAFIYSRKNGIRASGAKRKCSPASLANYEQGLNVFFRFQQGRGRVQWANLTRTDIRAFVGHVQGNPEWAESTKRTYLRVVRTLMLFIERDEECAGLQSWRTELPAIPVNEARKHVPSPTDLKQWRSAFDTSDLYGYRNYTAFCLYLDSGIRLEELASLRLDCLQLDNNQIFVTGKTGPRNVPITDRMAALLRGWLRRRTRLRKAAESPFVFLAHGCIRMTKSGWGQVFRKMRDANPSLPALTIHLLRHSFGTYFMKRGGELEQLRIIMGHQDIRTTSKYLHLAQQGSAEIKAQLEKSSPLAMLDGVKLRKHRE